MSSRRRLACFVPFFGFLAVMAACSDDDPRPPVGATGTTTPPVGGTTEGGTSRDSSTSFDSGNNNGDGSVCTSLTQAGNLIDKIGVNGDPPLDVGGTITDGTYVLTDDTAYVGDTTLPGIIDNQKRATIRISGGLTFEMILETRSSTQSPVTQTFASTYTVVTPQLTRSDSCPAGGATFTYTATDQTLKLTDLTLKEAFTYTLQ